MGLVKVITRARYFTFYSSNWVAPRIRALSSSFAKPYEVTKTSRWATFHVIPLEFILARLAVGVMIPVSCVFLYSSSDFLPKLQPSVAQCSSSEPFQDFIGISLQVNAALPRWVR